MEFIKQNRVVIATVVVMLAIIGVIWLNQQNDTSNKKETDKQSAQQQAEKNKQAADKKAAAEKQKQQAEKSRDYMYAAAAGDSYTAFARQSVQAYAKANSVELSKAQIIAAETTLTQKAGAPYLEVGDKLTIRHADLKASVDTAKALSPAQLVAWEQYVPYVVF
jgi:mannitol-specific phosphotransferase system IIBC component